MEIEFYASGGTAFIIWLVAYAFFAFVLMTIANKLGTENSWMAWVPILNIYLMVKMADRPGWWLILLLVPLVNFVIGIIIWVDIIKRRNRPAWWVILMLLPIVNLIVLLMLAFTEAESPASA